MIKNNNFFSSLIISCSYKGQRNTEIERQNKKLEDIKIKDISDYKSDEFLLDSDSNEE